MIKDETVRVLYFINSTNLNSIVRLINSKSKEVNTMKTQNPKKIMDCLNKALQAWSEIAPNSTFGGVTLENFEAAVNESRDSRTELAAKENAVKMGIVTRDNYDAASLLLKALVVNGVIGDPNFGPDSALYEAMGYIRKSERRSGLTRKKKVEPKS